MEGPELLAIPGRHVGACTYQFNFHVTVPGTYRVVAIAERTEYDATMETGDGAAPGAYYVVKQFHVATWKA